jgi:hypothetical protein
VADVVHDGSSHDDSASLDDQVAADFMLAQLMFHEELVAMDQQRRAAEQRANRNSATPSEVALSGLTAGDMATVGKVVVFDSPQRKSVTPQAEVDSLNVSCVPITNSEPVVSDDVQKAEVCPVEDDTAECCLCMEDLILGCKMRELPCGHSFHLECVDDWLLRRRTCPVCLRDVTREAMATVGEVAAD